VSLVARDDVADVVAAILTGDGNDGHVYDVTGREALTMSEVAALLAEHSGKPVSYKAETLEEAWESRASFGAPDWQVEAWVTSYTAIAAGELETIADTIERLTDHQPVTLAEYAQLQDSRPAAD
jgi:NAD(P)H dehydrogenase (quinone)